MGLNDISRGFGHGVGTLVGRTGKVLSWPGSTLSKAIEKLRSVFPNARGRTIVTEELMRLMSIEESTEARFEQRLRAMAETIVALQERLDELASRGHMSEMDMLEAMDSVEAAQSLTNDEKTVLANVFRQNIVIQRPELVGADIDCGNGRQDDSGG